LNDNLTTFWTGSVDGKYDFFHGTIGIVYYASFEKFGNSDAIDGIDIWFSLISEYSDAD
jgi:hypothetical protein